jgi:hypothetical protein
MHASSAQPAFHTIIQLGIDANLSLRSPGEFEQIGQRDENGIPQNWLRRRLSSPPDLPIFRESELSLNRSFLTFGYPEALLNGDDHLFQITTSVQTPGYDATERCGVADRRCGLVGWSNFYQRQGGTLLTDEPARGTGRD